MTGSNGTHGCQKCPNYEWLKYSVVHGIPYILNSKSVTSLGICSRDS